MKFEIAGHTAFMVVRALKEVRHAKRKNDGVRLWFHDSVIEVSATDNTVLLVERVSVKEDNFLGDWPEKLDLALQFGSASDAIVTAHVKADMQTWLTFDVHEGTGTMRINDGMLHGLSVGTSMMYESVVPKKESPLAECETFSLQQMMRVAYAWGFGGEYKHSTVRMVRLNSNLVKLEPLDTVGRDRFAVLAV